MKQYPPQYKKAAVIPALDLAQRQVRVCPRHTAWTERGPIG